MRLYVGKRIGKNFFVGTRFGLGCASGGMAAFFGIVVFIVLLFLPFTYIYHSNNWISILVLHVLTPLAFFVSYFISRDKIVSLPISLIIPVILVIFIFDSDSSEKNVIAVMTYLAVLVAMYRGIDVLLARMSLSQIYQQYEQEGVKPTRALYGEKSTSNLAVDITLHNMSNVQLLNSVIKTCNSNGFTNIQKLYGGGKYGVNLLAEIAGGKCAIRCNAEKSNVGIDAMYELQKGMRHYGCSTGIIFTNQYFTKEAHQASESMSIALHDRDFFYKPFKKGLEQRGRY